MEKQHGELEYKLDVLRELRAHGYSVAYLQKEELLSTKTIQQLRRYEMVSPTDLEMVCNLLHCDICDIIQMSTHRRAPHVMADWISRQLTGHPQADVNVLQFIQDCITRVPGREDAILRLFTNGYCYYFAMMLSWAFERGTLCVPGFKSHIVWLDGTDPDTNIAYDAYGVYDNYEPGDINNCLIPVTFFGPLIYDVLHSPAKKGFRSLNSYKSIVSKWYTAYKTCKGDLSQTILTAPFKNVDQKWAYYVDNTR